jgi:hypothetical protein
MTRNLCVIAIALVALARIAAAQVPPKDVSGWGKIKWTMTPSQAKAVYGPDLHEPVGKPPSGCAVLVKGPEPRCLVIDSLPVGEVTLRAVLSTGESDHLRQVALYLPSGTKENGAFGTLLNGLTQKYGSPAHRDSKVVGTEKRESATWIFPSTTIELYWGREELVDFDFLSLTYKAADKKAQDTL